MEIIMIHASPWSLKRCSAASIGLLLVFIDLVAFTSAWAEATAITGHVYLDANSSFGQEGDEPALAGVRLEIVDKDGNSHFASTDANGNWSVETPSGWASISSIDTSAPSLAALFPYGTDWNEGWQLYWGVQMADGQEDFIGNIGLHPTPHPTTLHGRVYADVNGNGIQDPGEPGIPGAEVDISENGGVVTDMNGDWSARVMPGEVQVSVSLWTSGVINDVLFHYWTNGQQTGGSNPAAVTAVAETDINAGAVGFAQQSAGQLKGHAYLDLNGNGSQDVGEPDMANADVAISLVKFPNPSSPTYWNSEFWLRVTADEDGNWTAPAPGGPVYIVVQPQDQVPSLWTSFRQTEGLSGVIFPQTGLMNDLGSQGFAPVTEPAITGRVYLDANGNGRQDPGEPGLPYVKVNVSSQTGDFFATYLTDLNGDWTTYGPDGACTVWIDTQDITFTRYVSAGFVQTEGSPQVTVTPAWNEAVPTGNWGFYNPSDSLPAVVYGRVYVDSNSNGAWDGGEAGLPAMDVEVADSQGYLQTVSTDAQGNWRAFVAPGPVSFALGSKDAYKAALFKAAYVQTESNTTVTAVAHTLVRAGDNGFSPGAQALVTGRLYLDLNADGVQQAGEPGLAWVQILVTDSNNQTRPSTTAADGTWTARVAPGAVSVKVDTFDADFIRFLPPGFSQSQGTNPVQATALAGTTVQVESCGFVPSASPATIVYGRLYLDANRDGLREPLEGGLADMQVIVSDSAGAVQTITTDSDGHWSAAVAPGAVSFMVNIFDARFQAVLPGTYLVTEAPDAGIVTSAAGAATNVGDTGYYDTSAQTYVWGSVFFDNDGDGAQGPGDPPMPDIPVVVTDSAGSVHTVRSDPSGNWIAFVPPGPVTAVVNPNDPWLLYQLLYVQVEGPASQSLGALPDSGTFMGTVALQYRPIPEPFTVKGHLYADINGNGSQDPGEPDMEGIELAVTDVVGSSWTSTTDAMGNWSFELDNRQGLTDISVTLASAAFQNYLRFPPYIQTEGSSPMRVMAVNGHTADLGNQGFYAAPLYDLSGRVRFDKDRHGSVSDEAPSLPGVTLALYVDVDGNGALDPAIDTLLVEIGDDFDGSYAFNGLTNGPYLVVETPPSPAFINTNNRNGAPGRVAAIVIADGDSIGNDFFETVDAQPQGWFYDTETGEVVPGGHIVVDTASSPGWTAAMPLDGSDGSYAWVSALATLYSIHIAPPAGYTLDPGRPAQPGSLDLSNASAVTGSGLNLAGTGLEDSSAGGNPWHYSVAAGPHNLAALHNNIPLLRLKPVSFRGWQVRHSNLRDSSAAGNTDGDLYTNLEEFAFDETPTAGVPKNVVLALTANADGTIDAVVTRLSHLVGLTCQLEYIGDLAQSGANGAGWTTLTTLSPVVVSRSDGTETATYHDLAQVPALASGQGFVRLRLEDFGTGTVARTLASGWQTRHLDVGTRSVGDPFLVPEVYSGIAGGTRGNVIDLSSTTSNADLAGQFQPGHQYFVEAISGPYAGQRWEVDEAASNAYSVAIDTASPLNTQPGLPVSFGSGSIVIREHVLVRDAFPPAKFSSAATPARADRLLMPAPGTAAYTTLWLFAHAGHPQWVSTGNATLADAGDTILDNAQGLLVQARTHPVTLTMAGVVRQNPFALPLAAGATMISGPWPMAQTAADRGMTLANGFAGGSSASGADKILFWNGDSSSPQDSYASHYLFHAGAQQFWTPQANASLANENTQALFLPLQAHFMQVSAARSTWLLPVPWVW